MIKSAGAQSIRCCYFEKKANAQNALDATKKQSERRNLIAATEKIVKPLKTSMKRMPPKATSSEIEAAELRMAEMYADAEYYLAGVEPSRN